MVLFIESKLLASSPGTHVNVHTLGVSCNSVRLVRIFRPTRMCIATYSRSCLLTVIHMYRDCFVTTDDSQATKTFLKAINKVLCADLRCILCDSSLGKFEDVLHC